MDQGNTVIVVEAPTRLHIGLIDLGEATARRYGGAGFSLDSPRVRLRLTHSPQIMFEGIECLDQRGRDDLLATVERVRSHASIPPFTFSLEEMPPQHVGFGTKTALLLGTIQALSEHSGRVLSPAQMQTLSGRGGVSGIGTHAFFRGTYLVDTGHDRTLSTGFLPSSARTGFNTPPLSTSIPIPPDWRFALILPEGLRHHGAQEESFFTKVTPIPTGEVLETLALVHHGITPAVAEADLELLGVSLRRLHEIGFKRRELDAQSESVRDLYNKLLQVQECAAGMSSMGPLIYLVASSAAIFEKMHIADLCSGSGARLIAVTGGNNTGHSTARV